MSVDAPASYWEMWSAIAGMGLFITTLLVIFHKARSSQFHTLWKRIDEVEEKAAREHDLLRRQTQDISDSMRSYYVSKKDLEQGLALIRSELAELRKDVTAVHSRIDDLFRSVKWRQD